MIRRVLVLNFSGRITATTKAGEMAGRAAAERGDYSIEVRGADYGIARRREENVTRAPMFENHTRTYDENVFIFRPEVRSLK